VLVEIGLGALLVIVFAGGFGAGVMLVSWSLLRGYGWTEGMNGGDNK
jgi:hypothetical protein